MMPDMHTLMDERKAKLIGCQFANDGHPRSGIAYWRWSAHMYQGKLYVVETAPKGSELETIIKVVDY